MKRTKSAEHSFVSGNWILWTYWQGDVIFPLAIAYLPWYDDSHKAAEHQGTVTDQNAASLAVLGAFYNADALSGQSTW